MDSLRLSRCTTESEKPCDDHENGIRGPVERGGDDGNQEVRGEDPSHNTPEAEGPGGEERGGDPREECASEEEKPTVVVPEVHLHSLKRFDFVTDFIIASIT